MGAQAKLSQLQIRVSEQQKRAIRRAAMRLGVDMSTYILERALPTPALTFQEHVQALGSPLGASYAFAELSSFLGKLSGPELRLAVQSPPEVALSPLLANYVAAMIESACAHRQVPLPAWTIAIEPLAEPYFGSNLRSLRLHLLINSRAPFRRRNLFVDTDVGDRV